MCKSSRGTEAFRKCSFREVWPSWSRAFLKSSLFWSLELSGSVELCLHPAALCIVINECIRWEHTVPWYLYFALSRNNILLFFSLKPSIFETGAYVDFFLLQVRWAGWLEEDIPTTGWVSSPDIRYPQSRVGVSRGITFLRCRRVRYGFRHVALRNNLMPSLV